MRWFFIICLSLCALVFCPGPVRAKDLPEDFAFVTIDGTTIDFKTVKGQPLVINIGASWCPECRNEAPAFQRAYLSYKDKGVFFIAVLGGSTDNDIKDFVQTYKLTFPVGKDNGLANAFGVRVVPQTFFFSRDGKLVKKIIGEAGYKELCTYIETILVK
jgi:thiol-disulfide isomerase/thioredoxin